MFRLQSMGGRSSRKLLDLEPHHIDEYPFTGLADVTQPFGGTGISDTGLYWQIPRSGGTTLKTILGTCLNRVQASRVARDHCDVTDDDLHLCQTSFGRYVNADPSDDPGIERSHRLELVGSGLADVLVSSRLLHVSELFDEEHHHGRAFTVFRHPVQRTASTFYYLQNAEWERQYSPELKTMSLSDFAGLESTANDWMVRWLTGKNAEVLTRSDLEFAKELLRRKFLVLLTDEMKTSVTRLASYMGWSIDAEMMGCVEQHSTRAGGANKSAQGGGGRPPLEPGTDDYEALLNINRFDVELYEYAQELFVSQWSAVQDRAKEHGQARPASLATGEESDDKSTADNKKSLLGMFARHEKNEPANDQDQQADNQDEQGETVDTSTAQVTETDQSANPVRQHGVIASAEDQLQASVVSPPPGSTVTEAARGLEQPAQSQTQPSTGSDNASSIQDQPSSEQHGLVSRETRALVADTTLVKKGNHVVNTYEMDMVEMKRRAQVALQAHKRRLGAAVEPPALDSLH